MTDDKLQEHAHIVDMLRPLTAKDIRDAAAAVNAFHDMRALLTLTASNATTHTIRIPPSAQVWVDLRPAGPTAAQRKQARQRQRKARKQNRG